MYRNTLAAAAIAALSLGGCSGRGSASGGGVPVVSAENFYGDIVQQIGGSHVRVTSIIRDPAADPHQYASNVQDTRAVADARLIVVNGLGYDGFMEKLVAASPASGRAVIHVDALAGATPRSADRNPHLWYDTPTVAAFARAAGGALVKADPKHAPAYRAGTRRVISSLASIDSQIRALRARFAGTPIAYTERVPGYLTARMGLVQLTPPEFARASEGGSDPSPQSVATMRDLVLGHRIRALLYNTQASSRAAGAIRELARTSGVPVVGISETSPPGISYQAWQLAQLHAIATALSSR
ncbi:MAG: metal ABC transporter solute-binding protein [Thermoleophilaceae bacterium]